MQANDNTEMTEDHLMPEKLPHEDYFHAVDAALAAAGLAPSFAFYETPDGERLDAVWSWRGDDPRPDANEWPHGVLICWSQFEGWQYAANKSDGSNEWPHFLVTEFIAAPESVVDAVRTLMRSPEGLPIDGTPWQEKERLERDLEPWLSEDD